MRIEIPSAISSDAAPRTGMIFLAQRLEELTSPGSLDSYRASTVNVPTLLKEGLDQISSILGATAGISPSSIDPIIEELTHRISGNSTFYSLIDRDREVIEKLRSSNNDALRSTLLQLTQEISGWAYATQVMNSIISQISDNNKNLLDDLCHELVTTLVNLGMTRRHIHETVSDFFWTESNVVSSPNDLRVFFRKVFPHSHDFTICFGGTDSVKLLSNNKFTGLDITLSESIPEKFSDQSSEIVLSNGEKPKWFLTVDGISALDKHTAIAIATKQISLIKNLYRMFNHDNAFVLSSNVAIHQCCEDSVKIICPEQYMKRSVSDSSERLASRKLSYLLNNSKFLRGPPYEKFVSVSDFHGLSMDSDSVENKLLNLWISLETICPSIRGMSKIDSVVNGVLPCIGLKYIDRLFSAAIHDISEWNRRISGPILDRIDSVGPSKKIQLVAMCTQKRYEPVLSDFLGIFGDNHLLRNRIFKLHTSFSDRRSALQALNVHKMKVDWQIRRVYRARNAIVHLGKVPPFINALVDSAHDYFDQLLSTVGDISCGPNGFNNFGSAFEYMDWEYNTYQKKLGSVNFDDDDFAGFLIWKRKQPISREEVLGPRIAPSSRAMPIIDLPSKVVL